MTLKEFRNQTKDLPEDYILTVADAVGNSHCCVCIVINDENCENEDEKQTICVVGN